MGFIFKIKKLILFFIYFWSQFSSSFSKIIKWYWRALQYLQHVSRYKLKKLYAFRKPVYTFCTYSTIFFLQNIFNTTTSLNILMSHIFSTSLQSDLNSKIREQEDIQWSYVNNLAGQTGNCGSCFSSKRTKELKLKHNIYKTKTIFILSTRQNVKKIKLI